MKRRAADAEHSKALSAAARALDRAHKARDAAVLAAAEAGMPRAHIAEDVDLTPVHVGRLIAAAKKSDQ